MRSFIICTLHRILIKRAKRMRRATHIIARMEEMNAYRLLEGKF
jgi:hypothetical protein